MTSDKETGITCPNGYGFHLVSKPLVRAALNDELAQLLDAFPASRERHGFFYWNDRALRRVPLSADDTQFLEFLSSDELQPFWKGKQ